jgi:hypothetical protein
VPEGALTQQPSTPRPPADQQCHGAHREGEQQLVADAVHLEDDEGHGEDTEREAGRVCDAPVLRGSGGGDVGVVSVEQPEHDQPDHGGQQRQAREHPRIGHEHRGGIDPQGGEGGDGADEHDDRGIRHAQQAPIAALPQAAPLECGRGTRRHDGARERVLTSWCGDGRECAQSKARRECGGRVVHGGHRAAFAPGIVEPQMRSLIR